MAKSGQGKKNNSKTKPATPVEADSAKSKLEATISKNPPLLEIDETICYRPSQNTRHQLNRFLAELEQSPINKSSLLKLTEQDDFPLPDILKLFEEEQEFEPAINLDELAARVKKNLRSLNLEVSDKNLETYLNYLDKNLEKPFNLTSREEFLWEDEYLYGGKSQKEYEKLKKIRPCYTDTFKFLGFDNFIDEEAGILVNVERLRDKKKFTLPLCDLKAIVKTSPNYQLLEDYSLWLVNYR
ncbi:calcium-binding protein [Ancylothrix sp. C2]|uniref:calcium-binding protein n=1 Tax=Ancylothrix sp. D3o TaxID=2953691 RepID=UPI0021BAD9B5|nr:calcium-binding protein [Ancylothrix sp. D3o]MCT7952117.1 calcium-binding protein [Ancylothrix sp. D3o]